LRHLAGNADADAEVETHPRASFELRREFYTHLGPWQRAQIARHQQRPYTLDFIGLLFTDFMELHGDRGYADDKDHHGTGKDFTAAGRIIGTRKGATRSSGWSGILAAEARRYRKALRVMQLAAKLGGRFLLLSIHRGRTRELTRRTRAGGSDCAKSSRDGAAAGTGNRHGDGRGWVGRSAGDCRGGSRQHSGEQFFYSVISPEGCASIIWRDSTKAETAAAAMRSRRRTLKELGIVDEIVAEPEGGAHTDHEAAARYLDEVLDRQLVSLTNQPLPELLEARYEKFRKMDSSSIWAAEDGANGNWSRRQRRR